MISKAFLGISSMGVSRVNLYFVAIASSCQNISIFLYFPKGAIPPFRILNEGSGIIFFTSISLTTPKPLHFGHAPCGELNEKVWGAGSLYEIPLTGHISLRLK